MAVTRIKCKGSISGAGYGRVDIPLSVRPYALYFLGSDYFTGDQSLVGKDLMGGADLTIYGSPTTGSTSATCTYQNCWKAPFTGAQLANAQSSQLGMTLVAVARVASTAALAPCGTYAGSGSTTAEQITLPNSSLTSFVIGKPGGPTTLTLGAVDANRGSRFGLYVAAQDRTRMDIYERHAGDSIVTNGVATSDRSIGAGDLMGVGANPYSPNWAGSGEVAMCAFYPRKLNQVEIEQVYADLSKMFAGYGVTL
jgi:hypothetical protein